MKRLAALLLILSAALFAQAPVVTVTSTVVATVGTLTCTGTPGVNAQAVSTMHMVCTAGAVTLHTSDSTVPTAPGTGIVISVTSGANSIAWLLTKGNPTPDQWQVSATDGTTTKLKTGSF